ncbi:hypothetical protein GCM10010961_37120 [Pseudodonghicola xiamenensis]|uniref:Uncharacterized protein n=1 Tax=Pseudodonghicola xiamenensis TaxID=337702 RepID=A0A8J3MEW3_9RHOB|nr:hypothetical protein GCM10010961_37120 [Pseudodonghicola xiamenensis]
MGERAGFVIGGADRIGFFGHGISLALAPAGGQPPAPRAIYSQKKAGWRFQAGLGGEG